MLREREEVWVVRGGVGGVVREVEVQWVNKGRGGRGVGRAEVWWRHWSEVGWQQQQQQQQQQQRRRRRRRRRRSSRQAPPHDECGTRVSPNQEALHAFGSYEPPLRFSSRNEKKTLVRRVIGCGHLSRQNDSQGVKPSVKTGV